MLLPPLAPVFCAYRELKESKETIKEAKFNVKSEKDDSFLIDTDQISSSTKMNSTKYTYRIDFNQDMKKINNFEKIYHFVNSPIVKFGYDKISFFIFLFLFSYIMLCDFYPYSSNIFAKPNVQFQIKDWPISVFELLMILWALSFMIQKIYNVIIALNKTSL